MSDIELTAASPRTYKFVRQDNLCGVLRRAAAPRVLGRRDYSMRTAGFMRMTGANGAVLLSVLTNFSPDLRAIWRIADL